jgi:hypothetical protein
MTETIQLQEQDREFSNPTKSRIFYTKPSITEQEVAYATDAARNGWGEEYLLA